MKQNKNLTLQIKSLPYSKMLKTEVADYTDSVINIVEQNAPQSPLINPVFNLLVAKKPDIAILRLSYGVDTERLKVRNLKRNLNFTISSFKLRVKMISNNNMELDMHIIDNAIKSHLYYLNKCKNDKQYNQKIAGFLDLLEKSEGFAAALTKFNLLNDFKMMETAHTSFNKAIQRRVNKLSKRPNVSTKELTDDLINTIKKLFKVIEVAQLMSSVAESDFKQDCTTLINELNQLSEMYSRSFSIREANNKRKAEKQKGSKQDDKDAATVSDKVVKPEESANAKAVIDKSLTETCADDKTFPDVAVNDEHLPVMKPVRLIIEENGNSEHFIDHDQPNGSLRDKQYKSLEIKEDNTTSQSPLENTLSMNGE